jgi:hypothetical protein
LDRRGPALHDGSRIQFGWSVLTISSEESGLRVCEPDFDGDPFTGLSPALDTTLQVTQEQTAVLQENSATGADARFDQVLVVVKGALETDAIFLTREEAVDADDSGWRIGKLDDLENPAPDQEVESLHVFELLKRRREIMPLLALPRRYGAIVDRGMILSIVPPP